MLTICICSVVIIHAPNYIICYIAIYNGSQLASHSLLLHRVTVILIAIYPAVVEGIGDMSDDIITVSSPEEETGLQGNSKLCIDVKYNTVVPDLSVSKEDTAPGHGLQGKSEYAVPHDTILDNIVKC